MRWISWIHRWLGIVALVPALTVAISGFALVHRESLGLKKQERGPVSALPFQHDPGTSGRPAAASPGGAFSSEGEPTRGKGAPPDEPLHPAAVPSLENWAPWPPELAPALWQFKESQPGCSLLEVQIRWDPRWGWLIKLKSVASPKAGEQELYWAVAERRFVEPKKDRPSWGGGPPEPIDWAKLVKDVHTGKFLGSPWDWLWADISAASILVLGITGVWVFFARRRKAAVCSLRQSSASGEIPKKLS
jgi:hypothetical protein